jgi:DNA-directed RNA polymerase specialized sigma24 family protein
LEITARYCETTIDLQIIHQRGSLIAIPIADHQPTRHTPPPHTVSPESTKPDAFPQTLQTWINARLEDGQLGRLDVNNHIMTTYALPLRVYLLGSSWRRFGEVDEIINGFFAGRLDKPEFFTQWRASGKRLRYWLINALRFHLQEQYRRVKRDHADALPDDPDEAKAHRDFDRAWAMSLIREACRDAQRQCAEESLQDHWSVFHQHHVEGVAYRDIAAAMDISPGRCAVMVRTATSRFKQAMADRLQLDGTPDAALDDEIDVLLEAIQ